MTGEKEKLYKINFKAWYQNLAIMLHVKYETRRLRTFKSLLDTLDHIEQLKNYTEECNVYWLWLV